ncbi:MAG: patatin family protein [Prevotella sp.]|nr:patatin family protein [Prevotella sp.]MBR6139238.1 patatin family protein [Prevotella sp.]
MKINRNTGLVLEGGGMRGVFTTGVLDAFMKHDMYFRYVVAVSAGACNGVSYMSHQIRRARIANINMLGQYDYIGLKNLITQRSIFDRKLLYDEFPNKLVPFDWETYSKSGAEFEVVTTNCHTGRSEYLSEYKNPQRLNDIIMASSALPFVSSVVEVDGTPMLDGGIIDSIPIQRAVDTGHDFNIVISTRNMGYRSKGHDMKLPSLIYDEYPRLRVALSHRIEAYNEQLEMMERMERWGEIVVIRPERPLEVGRVTRDTDKLERLYEEGFRLGEDFLLNVEG